MLKFFAVIVLVVIAVAGLTLWAKDRTKNILPDALAPLEMMDDHAVATLIIAGQPFQVEIVNTTSSITQGLSGRSQIGRDGMLFVLPERKVAAFWMKDMRFNLDLVWIDGNKIVGITTDVPAPDRGTSLDDLPSYSSTVPVTHVIELPAGMVKAKNWTVGTTIGLDQ